MFTVLSELLLLFGKIRSSDDTNIDLRLELVQKLHHFRRSCLGCENDAKNLYLSTLGESSINIEERNNFLGSRSHGLKNLSLSLRSAFVMYFSYLLKCLSSSTS